MSVEDKDEGNPRERELGEPIRSARSNLVSAHTTRMYEGEVLLSLLLDLVGKMVNSSYIPSC